MSQAGADTRQDRRYARSAASSEGYQADSAVSDYESHHINNTDVSFNNNTANSATFTSRAADAGGALRRTLSKNSNVSGAASGAASGGLLGPTASSSSLKNSATGSFVGGVAQTMAEGFTYTSPEYTIPKTAAPSSLHGGVSVAGTTEPATYGRGPLMGHTVAGVDAAGLTAGAGTVSLSQTIWPMDYSEQRPTFEDTAAEMPSSRMRIFDKLDTGDYLADFYGNLLREVQEDVQDAVMRLFHQEMEVRKRMYALCNADLFRVRFIEEARWELRERNEVIARREKLERSRIEKQLLQFQGELLVSGDGRHSEDYKRAAIELEEEQAFRALLQAKRLRMKREEEADWESYLMSEDRWRWDVELAVRHGMHQIQLDEHRHRAHLEQEQYPENLATLMHAMELEWVDLLKTQSAILHHQTQANLTKVVKDEDDVRESLRKTNRRVRGEFGTLHKMLEVQHHEESERAMLCDTADRLFSVLFSREAVILRGAIGLLPQHRHPLYPNHAHVPAPMHVVHEAAPMGWGGEVYPEFAAGSPLRKRVIQEVELEKMKSDVGRQKTEQMIKEQELQRKINEVTTKSMILDKKLSETQTRARRPSILDTSFATPPRTADASMSRYDVSIRLEQSSPHFSTPPSMPLNASRFYQRSVPAEDIAAAAALLT